jgi:phosphoribosylpyrophosphate synthetase
MIILKSLSTKQPVFLQQHSKKIRGSKKIEIISMAPIISEAMKRIANSTSVSSLFK